VAAGVIMGASIEKIVNSLVADVMMPPSGYVLGGVTFADRKIRIPELNIPEAAAAGGFTPLFPENASYGKFLQTTFDFLIISFCTSLLVKGVNAPHTKQEAAPPAPIATEKLLIEIRNAQKTK
jgi:large conductance mechanosensitive channel